MSEPIARSLPETLSREVDRLARAAGRLDTLCGIESIELRPLLKMIDYALDQAHTAFGKSDVTDMMTALVALRRFDKL